MQNISNVYRVRQIRRSISHFTGENFWLWMRLWLLWLVENINISIFNLKAFLILTSLDQEKYIYMFGVLCSILSLFFCYTTWRCMQRCIQISPLPPRWNSPCRDEGAYPPRSFNQSASTRRAQLSVAAKAVRSTDLLNHNVKTWVNTD